MSEDGYNLWEEGWIRVRMVDGALVELSLNEAFSRASEIQAIAGEIPTQDAAMLLFMQSVLARALNAPRTQQEGIDLWETLWTGRQLPLDLIWAYRDRYHDRFDLFDEEHPFMQTANLASTSGKTSGLLKLIADVPDGLRFFSVRQGSGVDELEYAEAARWLIHCQAYDTAGIKTGMQGDQRAKKGKSHPKSTGLLGQMGLVLAQGATLVETLLLNLPIDYCSRDDSACWEREAQTPGPDLRHPFPIGMADVHTWPSRRIRLLRVGGKVRDVLLSDGDSQLMAYAPEREPFTGWVSSGKDEFRPSRHNPEREMWRGLGALLSKSASPGGGKRKLRRAEIISWLARLRDEEEILDPDYRVVLQTVGMQYGTMSSKITTTIDDSIAASVSVITTDAFIGVISDAADVASQAVWILSLLAGDLGFVSGIEQGPGKSRAREQGYSALDIPFRRWISQLSTTTDRRAAGDAWGASVREIMLSTGKQMCEDVASDFPVGRDAGSQFRVQPGEPADVSLCWRLFLARLRKVIPIAKTSETHVPQEVR